MTVRDWFGDVSRPRLVYVPDADTYRIESCCVDLDDDVVLLDTFRDGCQELCDILGCQPTDSYRSVIPLLEWYYVG